MKKHSKKKTPPGEGQFDLLDAEVEMDGTARSDKMSALVSGRGPRSDAWTERAEVVSVSATGAGFVVPRECIVGALILLKVRLPAHLRCYDHDRDLYWVWGLVQYCHKSGSGGKVSYSVGVAFTGKAAPESYRLDPTRHYRVTGVGDDGLWTITESNNFKVRRDMRYWRAIELYLSRVNDRMQSIGGERAETENISRSGAAVNSTLDVAIGDCVKFICERYDFSALAVVCNRQQLKGSKYRLHLRFVGIGFPVEKIRTVERRAEKLPPRV